MRNAHAETGVTSSTVLSMSRGFKVSQDTLRRWATAIGEPVDDWYRWGGYDIVTREPVMDDVQQAGYGDLSPENRELLDHIARILRERERR